MKLNELSDRPGARTKRKRVGRGVGSGTGKTCGRGQKGQKSRSGVAIKGFEGGQMPLHMRLPKRGFNNRNRRRFSWICLGRIEAAMASGRLTADGALDEAALVSSGLIRRAKHGVRILSDGGISVPVHLVVAGASVAARAAVEKAGGSVKMAVVRPAVEKTDDSAATFSRDKGAPDGLDG